MTNRKIRTLIILMIAFLSAAQWAGAQKTYFVYIQSDNQQPFFVNLNGKSISSSDMGYVILSKLHDSTYPIKIGFPSGGVAPQEFDLTVNGNDLGLLLKDFGEKGYGLFNLQTLNLTMNSNEANKLKAIEAQKRAEAEKRYADSVATATALMAEKQKQDSIKIAEQQAAEKQKTDSVAVNVVKTGGETVGGTVAKETAAQVAPVVAVAPVAVAGAVSAEKTGAEVVKQESPVTAQPQIVKDTAFAAKPVSDSVRVAAATDSVKTEKAVDSAKTETAKSDSLKPVAADNSAVVADVSKSPDVNAAKATAVVTAGAVTTGVVSANSGPKFLDMELKADSATAEKKDTVVTAASPAKDTAAVVAKTDSTKVKDTVAVNAVSTAETKGTITVNSPNTAVVAPVVAAPVVVATEKSTAVTNSNCKKIAGEKDFASLRKKMMAASTTPEKILEAKSVFREKCFNNEQIRTLCLIFLDDESKLRFLDEAYPYSTDPQAYKQLSNLLVDDFYIRRFNAIIK